MTTHKVFWPSEQAATTTGETTTVTVFSWDYEQHRGAAMLPGGAIVTVEQQSNVVLNTPLVVLPEGKHA